MTLQFNINSAPKPSRFVHRSCRFPASSLSSVPPPAAAHAGELVSVLQRQQSGMQR